MKLPEMTKRNQILLILVLIIAAIPALFIYDYTQNNPKFCTTCHLMNGAYDTWSVSAMHDVKCHTCHETDMIESMNHVYDVLFKDPSEVTKPVEINNELCETCHASNDPQWLQVVNTAGHKVHFFGEENYADCIDCHGLNLHVFEPPEQACLNCHDPENVHASEMMMNDCITCHDFLVESNDLTPTRDNCLECHEQKGVITVSMPPDAHIDSSCTTCHNPHGTVTAINCGECHDVSEGLHAISLHADCTSCHVPHETVEVR